MRAVCDLLVLGLLLLVRCSWAQVPPTILKPPCDSPEAEEAALVALDFINAQHAHGYKYALNQIDEFKIIQQPGGKETYLMELDLLETKCHVLSPTPVANCTVRPKYETKVEADCDVALTKVGGVLSLEAFKCKSKPDSKEDMCLGCPELLPLNHTDALQVVTASLSFFNNKSSTDADLAHFALLQIGRLSSQIVSGGSMFFTEYAIVETNCTYTEEDNCVPLDPTVARYGFCFAKGSPYDFSVDCSIFETVVPTMAPGVNYTGIVAPPVQKVIPPGSASQISPGHGLRHHQLTALHDPAASGLLSESGESAEVPVVPVVPVVKREVPPQEEPVGPAAPVALVPVCPGRVRHF